MSIETQTANNFGGEFRPILFRFVSILLFRTSLCSQSIFESSACARRLACGYDDIAIDCCSMQYAWANIQFLFSSFSIFVPLTEMLATSFWFLLL